MSDEFRIPAVGAAPGGRAPVSASYRARRAGPDTGMLPIKLAAAGLFGLLLVGTAGWAVMGRRPAAIPVIEADSSPIRVKPDNPGGMQVAGAEEIGDTAGAGDRMAPVAESPAPQALRAQMQQATPGPDAPTEVPAGGAAPVLGVAPPGRGAVAGAPPVAGATAASAGASPLPDTPTRAVPGKPAAAAAPAPAKLASGAMLVQLGALGSEAAAQAEWQRLVRGMPDLLDGHQPSIQKTEHDGHTLWRLRTGGFADMADATGFCVKLHAKGGACTIASF